MSGSTFVPPAGSVVDDMTEAEMVTVLDEVHEIHRARQVGAQKEPIMVRNVAQLRMVQAMELQDDIRRVLCLRALPGGERWAYLIETPFETYPRFVVGTVNASIVHGEPVTAEIQMRHSAEWCALESWGKLYGEGGGL